MVAFFIVKLIIKKLLAKGISVQPTDALFQQSVDDLIQILKELL